MQVWYFHNLSLIYQKGKTSKIKSVKQFGYATDISPDEQVRKTMRLKMGTASNNLLVVA